MRDGAAEIQEDLPGHIKWPFQFAWFPQSSTLLKMLSSIRLDSGPRIEEHTENNFFCLKYAQRVWKEDSNKYVIIVFSKTHFC